jgi:hypothetical protein
MTSQVVLFNDQYFGLLKKLKTYSREKKQDSHNARVILRGIKKHYQSYDKLSAEFREYVKGFSQEWDAYSYLNMDSVEELQAWVSENADKELLYKDIPLTCIAQEFSDPLVFHHFLTMINMFRIDMSENNLNVLTGFLKNMNSAEVVDIQDDDVLSGQVKRLQWLLKQRNDKVVNDQMKRLPDIEDTSLGKLAKEIMQDMNIEELQKSIGDGDIMQALANPDCGLVKLLGTVSQKMISKISSGEIKQENLLQDAMKLATQLGGGSDFGALGNIASMFAGAGGGSGFDMSDIANMMGGMMGGASPSRNTKVRPNTANLNKMKRKHDLRAKLEKRKEAKENISGDVGGGNE